MHMYVQPWQVERMRDKVEELAGQLNVRIFASDGVVYRIRYNDRDACALYGVVYWSEGNGKEHLRKAWLHQVLKALNVKGVKVRVEWRDDGKEMKWFDTDGDPEAVQRAYRYIVSLH